jgi:DNA replication protein DnaC
VSAATPDRFDGDARRGMVAPDITGTASPDRLDDGDARRDAGAAAPVSAAARYAARRRLERSRLPRTYLGDDVALDALDTAGRAEALQAARAFAAGRLRGLLLTGDFGVGKSTLAAAAAKAYINDQGPLRWVRVHQVCIDLGRSHGDPLRADALDALGGSADGALVLDDLDKTRPTAYAAEVLLSAIDNAITDLRPLLVTTNLPVSGLAGRWPAPFGEAIASRLVGYCSRRTMAGEDRRAS